MCLSFSATFLFMILLTCIHCCCCGKPKYQGSRVQPLHPIWRHGRVYTSINSTSIPSLLSRPPPCNFPWCVLFIDSEMGNAPFTVLSSLLRKRSRDLTVSRTTSLATWRHLASCPSCLDEGQVGPKAQELGPPTRLKANASQPVG